MKNLPLGIQTFSRLINEGYLYVDKTQDIHRLFAEGGKYYFISRPRRFGKSLLLSTLKEIFSGNKELFKDLWIYDKIDWDKYPVIHIDFLGLRYETPEELIDSLNYLIDQNAADFGIELHQNGYDQRFKELIRKLSSINKVVILVDEYDKPIVDLVDDLDNAAKNRNILRNFYSNIKSADEYLQFAFITGVSKFSRVSVFSGLNNLRDITLSSHFSSLFGYTEEELHHYFGSCLPSLASSQNISSQDMYIKLKTWYNGYSWDGKTFVYNPFSILSLLAEGRFDNYWFSTGTPTFLTRLIRQQSAMVSDFEYLLVNSYIFDSFELEHLDIVPLLFQTGYLTIKSREERKEGERFVLSYPNKEVRDSFIHFLFREFTEKDISSHTKIIDQLVTSLESDNIDEFVKLLQWIFSSIPFHLFPANIEAFYHSIVYVILQLAGMSISAEVATNFGRIDAVIKTSQHTYIMEFKIGSAAKAIEQIKERKYFQRFLLETRPLKIVGIAFSPEARNISEYKVEEIGEGLLAP